MTDTYPLVEQRVYGRPGRRRGLLTSRPTRADDELPLLAPHHVRVFRTGEDYIADPGRLHADDPLVVTASSVTVVNCRVGVPVVVELPVPSADQGSFTARITFDCTVVDAPSVVRDGVTDVHELLLGYLRSVPGLVEDGADQPIGETTGTRDRIDARLTGYQEMTSDVVSGLRIVASGVEVLTPEEFAAHVEEVKRARLAADKARVEAELAAQQARAEHEQRMRAEKQRIEAAREEERHRAELAALEERHRQEFENMRTVYEQAAGSRTQEHELLLQARANGFQRNQAHEDITSVGDDPVATDFLALRSGGLTAAEIAERRRADEERRDTRAEEVAALQREYLAKREAMDRDDARAQLERDDRRHELNREDQRTDATADREERSRRWFQRREDRERRRLENREDARTQRQEHQEWRDRVLKVQHDLTARAISRGHGDDRPVDVGALISNVGETPQPGVQALTQGRDDEVQRVTAERLDRATDDGPYAAAAAVPADPAEPRAAGAPAPDPVTAPDDPESDSDDDSDIGFAGLEERRGD
ncbi:hypothetical protein OG711_19275 [Streptomyces uncialis]|uniref:hypothetical protein n=1 Tax=Streptomyces uncialis TaxID=1048205 RepID=UPI00225880EB|nr:hypothetical protein [Streptomyces uncialis]MCX4661295.1 hypothetical protein [Streptomyces uncialis]WTE12286.1 hypothetical protein OG924_19735 [Streptomyces uncialis]